MPHRAHLFSLGFAHALRETVAEGYSRARLIKDILAGITVGIIAIPLAMALAIASGVAPQYGLYTAIIGGFFIALAGGSRFSVSGPTAAFIVILQPIVAQHGLAGLLIASLLAGIILIVMAYARLGRFIEYIPESVTLGFTAGIAIVIATLQIPDFLGFSIENMPAHYVEKVIAISRHAINYDIESLAVASFTLIFMVLWPQLRTPLPAHLPAVILASFLAAWLNAQGHQVDTIGSSFHYFLADGSIGAGIPPYLPSFEWPWLQAGSEGKPFQLNWHSVSALLPAAFAIAMLGAIESLLCAVVLDGVSGKRHSANSELLGQGIGNIIAPFFGGITATAALARSSANFKAGAQSPVAAMVHALVVLLSLVSLATMLSYLPMPALAALLMVVAWNMSDAPKALHLVKRAPLSDICVFGVCLLLTVLFDMVIAITTGILLASVLFMREIATMTKLGDITRNAKLVDQPIPADWQILKINGPLFFAAADRVFGEVAERLKSLNGVVLYVESVPILDAGGVAAMNKLINTNLNSGKKIFFAEWQFQPLKTLTKAHIQPIEGVSQSFSSLAEAIAAISSGNKKSVRHCDDVREPTPTE